MAKNKNLESCNCILQKSKNLKNYELNYLLGRMTFNDVARDLAEKEGIHVSSVIVEIHMQRHISLETQEEMIEYLPSIASTCATMLAKVKSKAITFLDKPIIEDKEVKLLSVLVAEAGKYLDKYGQISGEADSVHTAKMTIAPSNFESAAMSILPDYPEVFIKIKEKMKILDKE